MKKYRIKKVGKTIGAQRYHNYLIRYNRAKRRLAKKGIEMFDIKYSRQEFDATYEATKNDMASIITVKKRPNYIGDVIGKMIDKQKYMISREQAFYIHKNWDKMKNLYEEYGEVYDGRPSIEKIREGEFDFDLLKDKYHQYRDSGMGPEMAARQISAEFFGSK